MALTKEKKAAVIERLKKIFSDSATVVFVNFRGLSVSDANEMRNTLRERGVGYTVVKKTLVRNALGAQKIEGETPSLDGELALAYLSSEASAKGGGEDRVAPASGIAEFAKTFRDRVTIMGGIFDGVFKSREEMTEIAATPPLSTLRGMFVNIINSPIQGLAVALSRIAEKKQ